MSKQTNEFQKLIHYIYSQIAPLGATVTESALIKEKSSQSNREIDILIEHEIIGTKLRIAVECRDRSGKDDITWIDGLIGKYRELDVNKIIAVSSSGFSLAAIDKAKNNNIDTLTLEKSLDTDWSKEFIKLGIAKVEGHPTLNGVDLEIDPKPENPPSVSDIVRIQGSETESNLNEFVNQNYNQCLINIQKYISLNLSNIFKALVDFQEPKLFTQTIPISNISIIGKDNIQREIKSLTFYIEFVFSAEEMEVNNHIFREANITSSTVAFDELNTVSIAAVQISGKRGGKVFITPKSKNKR